MNVTPLVIGGISILIGVLFIVFRKPMDRARDSHLESLGDHTSMTVRMLREGKVTILTGCLFILFGAAAIVMAFFPLYRM